MSEIQNWPETIGLGQYADCFEANHIDMDFLQHVDDQTLKDIGIASAGHRLRIRSSIVKTDSVAKPEVNATAAVAAPEASKGIADQIVDRTDGVPLFIGELTKSVVESGIIAEACEQYAVARSDTLAGDPGHTARLAAGTARSVSANTRGGADWRGARTAVLT